MTIFQIVVLNNLSSQKDYYIIFWLLTENFLITYLSSVSTLPLIVHQLWQNFTIMLYYFYFWLFTSTGVVHDNHIRRCSCHLARAHVSLVEQELLPLFRAPAFIPCFLKCCSLCSILYTVWWTIVRLFFSFSFRHYIVFFTPSYRCGIFKLFLF